MFLLTHGYAPRILISISVSFLFACNNPSGTDKVAFVPKTILSFDDSLAYKYNRGYVNSVNLADIIKSNFQIPDIYNRGGVPQYHTFLADFPQYQEKGIPYEWWPIISGNFDSKFPTVQEPSLYFSGIIISSGDSQDDINFTHPFQLRDYTFNAYPFSPSSEYRNLVYNSADAEHKTVWRPLHIEIEKGLFPYHEFGWIPQPNDAILIYGNWIIDAGHSPFETEMHPPAFMALAHKEGNKTVSFAYAVPFRTTELYNPDKSLANEINDVNRFRKSETKPFPGHLKDEISKIYAATSYRLEAHSLIEPVNIGVITWYVCDTSKHSSTAELQFNFHFTTRTGVAITATKHPDEGCIQFIASISPDYKPAGTNRTDIEWPWDQINSSAGVDVKEKIYDAAANPLHIPNPPLEKNPLVDIYDQLLPLANDNINVLPQIQVSDAQPFPFYGWANVEWRETQIIRPPILACSIEANMNEVILNKTGNVITNQLITITNSTESPVQIGKLYLDGADADKFALQNKTIFVVRGGGSQPPEDCSNTTLNAHASCSFRIAILSRSNDNLLNAVIHVPASCQEVSSCDLKIPIREIQNVQ